MGNFIWHVQYGNCHVICNTIRQDREEAKRRAGEWLGHTYADKFVVTPLATDQDRVHVALTLQV